MKVLHDVPGKLVECDRDEGRWLVEWLLKLGYTYKDKSMWTPDGQRCIGDFSIVSGTLPNGAKIEVQSVWHFEPDYLCYLLPLLRAEIERLTRPPLGGLLQ